jgi:hypothetical protein
LVDDLPNRIPRFERALLADDKAIAVGSLLSTLWTIALIKSAAGTLAGCGPQSTRMWPGGRLSPTSDRGSRFQQRSVGSHWRLEPKLIPDTFLTQ